MLDGKRFGGAKQRPAPPQTTLSLDYSDALGIGSHRHSTLALRVGQRQIHAPGFSVGTYRWIIGYINR
jgi:hypothetical protein